MPCSRCRKCPPMESSSVSTSMRRPECGEVVPVEQHRAEARPSGGRRCRARARACGSSPSGSTAPSAEHAGAHHVHRVRGGRDATRGCPAPPAGMPRRRPELALVRRELGRVGELAVHQQVGDLLEFAVSRRCRGCRSRGSAGRCRCARRCTARCCRRSRRRARRISSASGRRRVRLRLAVMRSWWRPSLGLCEKRVELLLVVVVAEVLVEVVARLHRVDHAAFCVPSRRSVA